MIFKGRVVRGQGLGRTLGFPTANLSVRGRRPPRGVYAARVDSTLFAKPRIAALNVGVRPTVGGARLVIEAHIPGFRGDLYGRTLTVALVRRLRGERKFSSLAALKAQIRKDVSAAKVC